jgi:hypothetical protein
VERYARSITVVILLLCDIRVVLIGVSVAMTRSGKDALPNDHLHLVMPPEQTLWFREGDYEDVHVDGFDGGCGGRVANVRQASLVTGYET